MMLRDPAKRTEKSDSALQAGHIIEDIHKDKRRKTAGLRGTSNTSHRTDGGKLGIPSIYRPAY